MASPNLVNHCNSEDHLKNGDHFHDGDMHSDDHDLHSFSVYVLFNI